METPFSQTRYALSSDSCITSSALLATPTSCKTSSTPAPKTNSSSHSVNSTRTAIQTAPHAYSSAPPSRASRSSPPPHTGALLHQPSSDTRQTHWRWQLPSRTSAQDPSQPPTEFETYLTCPFRYCLTRVLRIERGPVPSREMDAAVFGNLIHHTLEAFGHEVLPLGEGMLQLDEREIRTRVQARLEAETIALFGPDPAPAVRVQIANAARPTPRLCPCPSPVLRRRVADSRRREKARASDQNPLQIGSLAISGIIDRIDKHSATGASASSTTRPTTALKSHIAPTSAPAPPTGYPPRKLTSTASRRPGPTSSSHSTNVS